MTEPQLEHTSARPRAVNAVVEQMHRIWEQKAAGLIYEHYLRGVKVHRPLGDLFGRDEVVADTVQQLAAFPECRLRGEQVIWKAQEQPDRLYVSHWAARVAHNTGYSMFGKPTHKRVCYPVATDLFVHENRVAEVWTVPDGLLLAKQLGLSLDTAIAASEQRRAAPPHGFGEVQRLDAHVDASYPTPSTGVSSFVLETWHEIWNRRRLDRVAQRYRANYRFIGPSGRRFHTRDAFAAYILSLLAAFPDATMHVEHIMTMGEEGAAHAAVRWRLLGTHDGPGYGVPTGQRVTILGVTHHLLQGSVFVEERTVFDELALWVQLRAAKGAYGRTESRSGSLSRAKVE